MKKVLISLIFILVIANSVLGQTWYFGNKAGINFSPSGVVSAAGNQLNALEGTAITNDANGNLLFYTNGKTIIDKGGQIMKTKDGVDAVLNGDPGSTQSAVIIPVPAANNANCEKKYYVFTVGEATSTLQNGLFLSEIDFTNPAYTNGCVSRLNVQLLNDTITEKITAFNDGNSGYWFIIHGFDLNYKLNQIPGNYQGDGNVFHKFHITPAFPDPSDPSTTNFVYSSQRIGSVHCLSSLLASGEMDAAGQMKFSLSGRRLAVALYSKNSVDLFDFNSISGQLSNFRNIDHISGSSNNALIYGLEFSPDENLLYASSINYTSGIFQINLNNNPITISNVSTGSSGWNYGLLQMGPDLRIYCANHPDGGYGGYLGIINDPNLLNSTVTANECGYHQNGIALTSGHSAMGLPTIIQNEFTCGNVTETTVSCACPSPQQIKLNIYTGRSSQVVSPVASLNCGGQFAGECFKNYRFTSTVPCPDGCENSSIIRIVSPDKKDTTGNISNFSFTKSGDWTVLVYPKCGNKDCELCKFTIRIPPCVCPPPECCKDQVSFGDNASIKMTASGTGSILTIASTISAGSTTGYKEVRIDVLDVAIESENKNPACMGCLTNPRQWGSIQRAYVNGFTLSQEIPQMNNPREVRFISATPKPLNNTPFGFHIILPPPSTLECCKLYAVVTIKITVKDDQCRECVFISRTKLLLANWQMGDVAATGSPSNNNNTGTRKKNDLFSGCQNCIPVSGLRGVKTAGVKY